MTTLYLAVPCYNEEEVLQDTTIKLQNDIIILFGKGGKMQ